MTAIAKDQLKPYALGYLGLAGAFIRECGLIEKIDSLIPKESNNVGHFTHGQVVALMILNGLGYTTRPLYMSNTFFDAKDVEAMLEFEYRSSWYLAGLVAEKIGIASQMLGAGRAKKEDKIDPAVGLIMHKRVGDPLSMKEPFCTLYVNDETHLDDAVALLHESMTISGEKPSPSPLVYAIVKE